MNQIVNELISPSQKIQTFKKGLISALKCINIKHRYKEFSNTIYGDYANWQQMKIVRKNSQKRMKNQEKNEISHKNVKYIRQRNSFPRPNNVGKKHNNMYGKVEKISIQQNNKEQKTDKDAKAYKQNENHKKITLNIRTIKSTKKLPRLSNQKILTTANLNQKALNQMNEVNLQSNNQFIQQTNLIIVNRLKNTLKLNKNLFNQKPQKLQKKYDGSKANSLQLAHPTSHLSKTANPPHEYSKSKDNMDICSWFEQQQYKQSNIQTPTFGIL